MPDTVICFDCDGTLVDSQGRIHPADVQILAQPSSAVFVPATGRLLPSVRRMLGQHGLFAGRPVPFPLVLQNGAALYGPDEVLVGHQAFPLEIQNQVIDRMVIHPEIASFLFGLEEVFLLWDGPLAAAMARRFDLDPRPFIAACRQQALTKYMCISATPEALRRFAAELADLPLELACSLPTVLEINRPGVDKGRGLRAVLARMGLAGARIVAAGDGENDLPLFALADLAFAPSSSPPAIQARAGRVLDVHQTGLLAPILETLG